MFQFKSILLLLCLIVGFSLAQQSPDFYVCHSSPEMQENTKFFVRIENKEKHSVYAQIFSKDDGEQIFRLHPSAVLEQWIDSPEKKTRISIATHKGEECGLVRIVLWDYNHYVMTMIWIVAIAFFWLVAICALGCTCLCCIAKARKNAHEVNKDLSRYQKMSDRDEYINMQPSSIAVSTSEEGEESVPFPQLTSVESTSTATGEGSSFQTPREDSNLTDTYSVQSKTRRGSLTSQKSLERDSLEY